MTPIPRHWRPTPFILFSIGLHVAAAVALAVRPSLWPWLLAAVLVDHLLLTAAGLWPRSRLLGPNMTRLPAASAVGGAVAITIDDGPDPDVTPMVLDLLEMHNAQATFFCIAERAARHPDLIHEIARRGHAIENHSLRHSPLFSFYGVGRIEAELRAAQEILTDLAGAPPLFFRAPAGLRSPLLEPALCRIGLQLAAWTRRGFDTREHDPLKIAARLTEGLQPGDILLLHDGNAARGPGGVPVILAVLPRVLQAIRVRDLVTVRLRDARP